MIYSPGKTGEFVHHKFFMPQYLSYSSFVKTRPVKAFDLYLNVWSLNNFILLKKEAQVLITLYFNSLLKLYIYRYPSHIQTVLAYHKWTTWWIFPGGAHPHNQHLGGDTEYHQHPRSPFMSPASLTPPTSVITLLLLTV